MPTDSYRQGPGTLTLGTDPDDLEFSMQLTNCRVEPSENVTAGDVLNLLDGSTLRDDDQTDYTFILAGTAVQDLKADGITDYTWANAGDEVAFVFVPNTARVASVEGVCRIAPITIGGDNKKRNTADFSWSVIGTPEFTPHD